MRTKEAIAFFKNNVSALARAAEVKQSTIYTWGEYPPGGRQLLLERKTRYRLRAEPDCMKPRPRVSKAA